MLVNRGKPPKIVTESLENQEEVSEYVGNYGETKENHQNLKMWETHNIHLEERSRRAPVQAPATGHPADDLRRSGACSATTGP